VTPDWSGGVRSARRTKPPAKLEAKISILLANLSLTNQKKICVHPPLSAKSATNEFAFSTAVMRGEVFTLTRASRALS
jgi:hypothetical protein